MIHIQPWETFFGGKVRVPNEQDEPLPLQSDTFELNHEGWVVVEFGINEPLSDQLGRYLIRRCSKDGRQQLSVWQTYRNQCHLELVHEAFGRRVLVLDLNHLSTGTLHKMAFTWAADGIRCSVNGGGVIR